MTRSFFAKSMSPRSPITPAASACRCSGTRRPARSSATNWPTSSGCSTARSTASARRRATTIPQELREEIEPLNARIYATLNNGVYRCGFARTQSAYDESVAALFETLDVLEARLATGRFLTGERVTEADWRLFVTLLRFDAVYVGLFKCNLRRIADYPQLSRYLGELRSWPGVADTIDMFHIKHHYYESLKFINPTGIVPIGPAVSRSCGRAR